MVGSSSPDGPHSYISKFNHLAIFQSEQPVAGNSNTDAAVYGSPLTPMEYESFFEVKIKFSCYVTYFFSFERYVMNTLNDQMYHMYAEPKY